MTTPANSERERLLKEPWWFSEDRAQIRDMLKVDATELTALRASLSRRDEEIEIWRKCLAEIQQDGCSPEESMEDLWDRTLDRIQSTALAAADAAQAEGRQEADNARAS